LVVVVLLPPPFLVLVLMQVLVLLLMPLVLVHRASPPSPSPLPLRASPAARYCRCSSAARPCCLLQQRAAHDVRPHTPYKQHDSKHLAPPKQNVRAIQPIKAKTDRRIMCPWGSCLGAGRKENDATAGGAKKLCLW
jgi:hypothetical protein